LLQDIGIAGRGSVVCLGKCAADALSRETSLPNKAGNLQSGSESLCSLA